MLLELYITRPRAVSRRIDDHGTRITFLRKILRISLEREDGPVSRYLYRPIAPESRTREGENVVGAPDGEARASTALADDHRVEERLVEKDMVEQQQAVSAPGVVRCVDVRPSTSIATQSSS